jgi:cation transport ATPase
LGRRSRKSGRAPGASATRSAGRRTPPGAEQAKVDPAAAFAARAAKTEARNAEVRARLQPLEDDEHPTALKIAIGTCIVLALSNAAIALSGYQLEDEDASYVGVVLFELVLFLAAWGMYKHRYWAILGFQALLALTVLIAGLSVVVASNAWALILCLAVIGFGGYLFWSMIRVMARVQMPEPRAREPR